MALLPLRVYRGGGEGAAKGVRVTNWSDIPVLQFQKEHASRGAESQGEDQEEDRTNARGEFIKEQPHDLNEPEEGNDDASGTGCDERPLLIGKPVGDAQANDGHQKKQMEYAVATGSEQRKRETVDRREWQQHRNEDQSCRSKQTDQRVRRTNGPSLYLAGLSRDRRLELVKRGTRGGAKLLPRRSSLRAALRLALLARGVPLRATPCAVLRLALLAPLCAVLRLPKSLLRSSRLLGRLAVSGRLSAGGVLRGHRFLPCAFGNRTFEFIIRRTHAAECGGTARARVVGVFDR